MLKHTSILDAVTKLNETQSESSNFTKYLMDETYQGQELSGTSPIKDSPVRDKSHQGQGQAQSGTNTIRDKLSQGLVQSGTSPVRDKYFQRQAKSDYIHAYQPYKITYSDSQKVEEKWVFFPYGS